MMASAQRAGLIAAGLIAAGLAAACGDGASGPTRSNPSEACQLDPEFVAQGAARGAIPELTDPPLVPAEAEGAAYLSEADRVIGFVVDDRAYAVPHNVLWWHEIVNLDVGTKQLAVTYCPLTGTGLVFDRRSIRGWRLGVSGLLFKNNLVMFAIDRPEPRPLDAPRGSESLWPQMQGTAKCGPDGGVELDRFFAVEMRWEAWRRLHPSTLVVSDETGHERDYTLFPYGAYESLSNDDFLFPEIMPDPDPRRPAKERVVGVPPEGDDPGIAFPFRALSGTEGERSLAVEFPYRGEAAVLLWSGPARSGMAYRPRTGDGETVTLRATEGGFEDAETGSVWSVEGTALTGPLAGSRLQPLERTFVAFWGAWAAFFPGTRLWEGA